MKHLFYFLAIFPIMWELRTLLKVKETHQFAVKFKALKSKKFDEYSKTEQAFAICMTGYMIWMFAGFMTSQWVLFIGLFMISLIPKKQIWYRWIDSFISIVVLIFIIINAYHLKIDIWQIIKSMF